jgi:hypothetical protein
MGKFTHSYVIVGPPAERLADFYRTQNATAFIFQDNPNACAILEEDDADLSLIAEATAEFQTSALLGQVLDSSVFVGTVYDRGVAIDEYIDYPEGLFGRVMDELILNLDRDLTIEQRAAEWANLFGASESNSALANVFRQRDKYVFAEEFHAALLEALRLPTVMVGAEFREIEDAYRSDVEAREALVYIQGEILEEE